MPRGEVMKGEESLIVTPGDEVGLLRSRQGVAWRPLRASIHLVGCHGQGLFPRFSAAGFEDTAAEHERVHCLAGGEDIFEAGQQVAFVEVGDGILELEEVSGVGEQGILDGHLNAFAFGDIFRLLLHGWRYQDVVGRIFDTFAGSTISAKSNAKGVYQHDPFSWKINVTDFQTVEKIRPSAVKLDIQLTK